MSEFHLLSVATSNHRIYRISVCVLQRADDAHKEDGSHDASVCVCVHACV